MKDDRTPVDSQRPAGVVELYRLAEEIIKSRLTQGAERWADAVAATNDALRRAAMDGRLKVRHPETLLPESYNDWPDPSRSALVCTAADVNEWLQQEGAPYRLNEAPANTITQTGRQEPKLSAPQRDELCSLAAAGWTQTALAERFNVSRRLVAKYIKSAGGLQQRAQPDWIGPVRKHRIRG